MTIINFYHWIQKYHWRNHYHLFNLQRVSLLSKLKMLRNERMDIMTGFEFDNEIAKELRKLKFVMWRYSKLQPNAI